MKRDLYLENMKKEFSKCLEIMKNKASDYANDVDCYKNFKIVEYLGISSLEKGILTRITDKLSRISNLLNRENKVKDESIEDTLRDLCNYSIILLVYLKNKDTR